MFGKAIEMRKQSGLLRSEKQDEVHLGKARGVAWPGSALVSPGDRDNI
jgi:hypothetical protein